MKNIMTAIALATIAASGVAIAQDRSMTGDVTRAQAEAKAAQWFDKLDVNHDGKLDAADRAARIQQMFDRIDTDHNGQISRDEFAAARTSGPNGPRKDRAGRGNWHAGMGPGAMMHMARMAETNGDSAISKPEFIAEALKRFDAADTNHDGVLTRAEREAARKAMRDKWRAGRDDHNGARDGAPNDAPPPPAT